MAPEIFVRITDHSLIGVPATIDQVVYANCKQQGGIRSCCTKFSVCPNATDPTCQAAAQLAAANNVPFNTMQVAGSDCHFAGTG
jgi:hypothetical protein